MSHAALRSAAVVRRGTAIEVETADGAYHLLRGRELGRTLGRLGLGDIAGARVLDDALVVELASGERERVEWRASEAASLVIRGARLATCDGPADSPLGIADDAAVIAGGGRILWLGPSHALEAAGIDIGAAEIIDARGRLLTPGLIDCHAHPLFGGDRADEFEMRARGASYREISDAGGGISATVEPTRSWSFEEHVAAATERADRALAGGTTTLEAKSGYDLRAEGELRLLEVAAVLDSLHPVDLVGTLLGAHVVPPERATNRAGYVAEVATEMVPRAAAAKLCTSVDVYCDEGAFDLAETRAVLEAAVAHGLATRAHVGQFADLGGPQLLAELGALSADHLEEISTDGIGALAAAGVVAVMLPGACVQLEQEPPPVMALRAAGVTMAVASDMNPGSSFCETLVVPMWLATTRYGMTVDEAWLGVTRAAAQALGRTDIGRLAIGAMADAVLWDCERPAEVPYRFGTSLVSAVVKAGHVVVRT